VSPLTSRLLARSEDTLPDYSDLALLYLDYYWLSAPSLSLLLDEEELRSLSLLF